MEFDFPKLFSDEIFQYFLIGNTCFALFIWIFNLATSNISHMDRLWGILPNVYSALFLFTAVYFNPASEQDKTYSVLKSDSSSLTRLGLMSGLMLLWGVRIVYVFWRRGYYRMDHEDHRWESVRAKLRYPERKLPFHIYNFVLMAFIQNWILIGHALPMWFVQTNRSGGRLSAQAPLNAFDIVLVVLFLVFFMFEYFGDEQQWNFQENKKKWLADTKEGADLSRYTPEEVEDYKRGFLVKGLFAYCRHPNYFGELFMWWTIWAFTLSSQFTAFQQSFQVWDLFNYACYSSIIMTLLFPRSSKITEKICMSKYAEYKSYIAKTNMILPSFSRYVPEKQE